MRRHTVKTATSRLRIACMQPARVRLKKRSLYDESGRFFAPDLPAGEDSSVFAKRASIHERSPKTGCPGDFAASRRFGGILEEAGTYAGCT